MMLVPLLGRDLAERRSHHDRRRVHEHVQRAERRDHARDTSASALSRSREVRGDRRGLAAGRFDQADASPRAPSAAAL